MKKAIYFFKWSTNPFQATLRLGYPGCIVYYGQDLYNFYNGFFSPFFIYVNGIFVSQNILVQQQFSNVMDIEWSIVLSILLFVFMKLLDQDSSKTREE